MKKIYDFSEMYDENKDEYIVRIGNDYYIFDDDDIGDNCNIIAYNIREDNFDLLHYHMVNEKTQYYVIKKTGLMSY